MHAPGALRPLDGHPRPYVCDTDISVFDANPELLTYKHLIVECTFFGDDSSADDPAPVHIYWDQLRPIVDANPGVHFILIHFSMRYTKDRIRDFFEGEKHLHGLVNMTVWLN